MLAARFGEALAGLDRASLPEPVASALKLRLLDTLGAALAGVHLGNHRPALGLLESGREEAGLWGEGRRASVREATLVNAFATHSTYLEDGSRFTGGHPSSACIPAAFAQAEARHASGAELLCAIAAGYEVFLRLGRVLYPATVVRGFQSTAVLAGVSSAAAAARALRLPPVALGHAIAIAANLGCGLKEALQASASQPIQVGRSAEGGVVAAHLAQAGLPGAPEILEHAFLPAFGEAGDAGSIVEGLGRDFRVGETYVKRHAGCRGNHAPLDAALALAETHALAPASIRAVRVFVDTVTRRAAIEPPKDAEQAQFSIGFSVAVALLHGDASLFQYTDARLAEPAVRDLMGRIEVGVDPALDAGYPERRAARVEIDTNDGRTLVHAVDNAKGEPEWPLAPEDIEAKFMAFAAPRLGPDGAQALRRAVLDLDAIDDVGRIARLAVPGATP